VDPKAGQVAVITGGASGIGLALAAALARHGVDVVLADIDQDALVTAARQVAELGVAALPVRTDVTDAASMRELERQTLNRFGRVDIIVNNAGTVGKSLPVWEYEEVEWEWILGVDLWGVIHGVRTFVPHLVAQGSGYVINTASMAGLSVVSLLAPYAAAKHAVVSLSETLWADLQDRAPGVGVTVVCPGPTLTRLMTEGGRNRPASLMPSIDAGIAPQHNPATFSASSNSMFSPEQVADATLEAMRRDQLYLAPNPGSLERIDRRLNRIRTDVQALAVDPAEKVSSSDVYRGS
jgi:NAD(P)-dependent dehydrogenase (short-subunit alcohol dehydrogenase family)